VQEKGHNILDKSLAWVCKKEHHRGERRSRGKGGGETCCEGLTSTRRRNAKRRLGGGGAEAQFTQKKRTTPLHGHIKSVSFFTRGRVTDHPTEKNRGSEGEEKITERGSRGKKKVPHPDREEGSRDLQRRCPLTPSHSFAQKHPERQF